MRMLLLTFMVSLCAVGSSWAADLTPLQSAVMGHEYDRAVSAARSGAATAVGSDRAAWLYYLGESLVLNRDFVDALQIFRSLIAQYPGNEFALRAMIRSADAYYLLEKYQKALDVYKHFLLRYAGSKYAPQAYVKAYYAAKKVGAWDDARSFADTLRQKYPRAIEISLVSSADQAKTMYDFKAQVGVFANRKNADILARKLERSGFSPSVTEDGSGNERVFRVVCGAYADPDLADRLVRELKSKGYPAKRIP